MPKPSVPFFPKSNPQKYRFPSGPRLHISSMRYSVFFAVHLDKVTESQLLESLAHVTRDFDESPQTMLCLLAEPVDGVIWFTFVCSVFKREAAMAAGFFRDVLSLAKIDFATFEQDDLIRSDVVFRHFTPTECDLVVRSDGNEVAVSTGTIDPAIPREGDAVQIGLRALGWPTTPAWESIGSKSRRIVLREKKARRTSLRIEPRTADSGKLPPVSVIRGRGEIGFSYWRDNAKEKFPLKPLKLAPVQGAILRVDVRIGKPGSWPDFSAVEVIRGRLSVIDSHDPKRPNPSEWGLKVVDLGAIRVMKNNSTTLYVQGRCEKIIAKNLESADCLEFRGAGEQIIEMPKLASVRYASIRLGDCRELVLPELQEVRSLRIYLPNGPFVVKLPKLREGEIVLIADVFQNARIDDSVLEIPFVNRENIKIQVRDDQGEEQLKAFLGPAKPMEALEVKSPGRKTAKKRTRS